MKSEGSIDRRALDGTGLSIMNENGRVKNEIKAK
jgi:hypothetical protein